MAEVTIPTGEVQLTRSTANRLIPLMQKSAAFFKLEPSDAVQKDPHFWYLIARGYETHVSYDKNILVDIKVPKDTHRTLAFTQAYNEALKIYDLEKKAGTDPLTGVMNRAALNEYILNLLKHPTSEGVDVLIMFDVDRFKQFNDKYGHQVGDAVLKSIVKLLKEITDETAVIARFGGEEFILVLPEFANGSIKLKSNVHNQLENIRSAFQKNLRTMASVLSGKQIEEDVTSSFGVYVLSKGMKSESASQSDVDNVLGEVDACLYKAKNGGRNRVEIKYE